MKIKICLVGDDKVGKTTLCEKLINGKEMETFQGHSEMQMNTSKVTYNDTNYILEFNDYFEKKEFKNWDTITINSFDVFLLVYSISEKSTFEFLEDIHKALNSEYVGNHAICILVGNKLDLELEREVSYDELKLTSNFYDCGFIECSADENTNIDDLNYKIIEEYLFLHQYDEIKEFKKEKKSLIDVDATIDDCNLL
eukprot:gene10009-2328_t